MTLLELRSNLDLSQLEAAKIAGISAGVYCKAENGRPVSKKIALKICTAFKVNLPSVDGLVIAPRPIKRPTKSVV